MKNQDGFTIVEVIVSMVMMAVVLTTLGGMTYATARQAIVTSDSTARQAASLEAVNRFATLPFDDLVGAAGCDTVGTAGNRYERCATVTTAPRVARIRIVTTPLQRDVPASTTNLVRSNPPAVNPLCTSC
jgi:prepilin-type N-terminal cleavage/methylation domain-containing protein